MKKIISLILMLVMMISVSAFAEETLEKYGAWELRYTLDEFELPTEDKYIVSDFFEGKFSNSATSGSELSALVFCDTWYFSVRLLEYGGHIVNNPYSSARYYDIAVMAGNGEKYYMTGTMVPGMSSIYFLEDGEADKMVEILKAGGTIRFAITDRDNTLTKYSFVITDASGFAEAFDNLMSNKIPWLIEFINGFGMEANSENVYTIA